MEKEMKRRGPPTLGVLVPWWFNPLLDFPQRHEGTKNAWNEFPVDRAFPRWMDLLGPDLPPGILQPPPDDTTPGLRDAIALRLCGLHFVAERLRVPTGAGGMRIADCGPGPAFL